MLAEALAIHLICSGGGIHKSPAMATARDMNDPAQAITIQHPVRSGYADEVEVEISGANGRIRVPDGVKPPIRSGGDDGWWELKKIEVGSDEIKAKFSLNFINNPQVRIDRRTGSIRINGKNGELQGYCEAFNPAAVQRKF